MNEKLFAIFDAARDEIMAAYSEYGRARGEYEERLFLNLNEPMPRLGVDPQKVRANALEQAVAYLSEMPKENLPRLAATYFSAYHQELWLREFSERNLEKKAKHVEKVKSYLRNKLDVMTGHLAPALEMLRKIKQARRKGAAVRHVENRAIKADVFIWLDANMTVGKTMDEATSEIIAARLVPMKWRTIRSWVSEWKKLRPASTQ